MITQDEQKEIAKEKILTAAVKMMRDPSLSTLNTNDLAKEAGVSKGLIFHHFGSKDNLMLMALNKFMLGLFDTSGLNPKEMMKLPPDVILRHLTINNLELIINNPSVTTLLIQIMFDLKDKSHLRDVEDFVLDFFGETIEIISPLFISLGWDESEVIDAVKIYLGALDGLGIQHDIDRNLIHHAGPSKDHHNEQSMSFGLGDTEKIVDIIVTLFDKR